MHGGNSFHKPNKAVYLKESDDDLDNVCPKWLLTVFFAELAKDKGRVPKIRHFLDFFWKVITIFYVLNFFR